MPRNRTIAACVFSLVAIYLMMAAGASAAPNNGEGLPVESLAHLYNERIARLELEIRNESERRTTILHQLDQAIDKISAIEQKSRHSHENTPPIAESLEAIAAEAAALENDVRHKKNLLKQLQDSLKQQPQLSVWQAALGSAEVQTRQRLLATQSYLIYTTRKHQQQLQNKRTLLDQRYKTLIEYENSVKQSIGEMQGHFNKLVQQRKHLEHQLTEISSQIVERQDRISSLKERSTLAQTRPASLYFGNFENKLKDPVEGRVIRAFSEPKAKGLLKWKGILIEAPLGLPFTSVSDGLVVFADELQGLGKVAIVDHGHGYMTLYGMAELLLVEKNQFLLAGDPVGTIGESVSADASALYFEVRHNADALDPQNWLEMRQIAQKN